MSVTDSTLKEDSLQALNPLPVLDERYYLRNFQLLCDTVQRQYEDLLVEPELAFLGQFRQLSEPARCLYVRLVSRVGPRFRSEKLSYPELGALDSCLEELIGEGFLCLSQTPELAEIFRLCRKDEVSEIFATCLENPARCSKLELLEQLQGVSPTQCEALWAGWYRGELVEPLRIEVVELLLLLFFGNRHQSLTEFVLSDLGLARYHDYPLDRGFRLFEQRSHVQEYLQLGDLRQDFFDAVEEDDQGRVLALVDHLAHPEVTLALRQRWDSLRNRVARQLERYQQWSAALAVYACSGMHPARERRVRILQNTGKTEAALELCLQMGEEAWCEEELDFLQRQIPVYQKKLGLPYRPAAKLRHAQEHLLLARGSAGVEMAAAGHYLGSWQQVHFVENSLINTLFGLALWEEIFLPLPGAFVNPFQSAPLDMHSREFYCRRKLAIDSRLERLAGSELAAQLLANYDRYHGVSNRWVNWRYIDRELVRVALEILPAAHLLAIWRRILFDPQANRSGFPDLLALDTEHGYCMIEVKGPGDQLQPNQKRWLRFFQQEEIPSLVAWVDWADD